ncbi:hypothetical protein H0A36_09600 [Endozoicomonas sp. SM1973]|uniref:Uncharacterized protein n=1 Tax=Spartinivicinus marinus TaxID=2994442 RepID=A0A853IAJ0_9GAMM|nr:hypothetical protein [Spartinivicinus marinus]MCX4024708.1 hypothetical protein [Spartinivicinus marinus]NYZ66265.1 hypothetical protein [Spartinivicinus marinus]
MKNKAAVLALGLGVSLVTGQAFSANERTLTWYSSGLGNQLVIDTTFGCIDQKMMYEKHIVKANSWNGEWDNSDNVYLFQFYPENNAYNNSLPVHAVNTKLAHDANGKTTNAFGKPLTTTIYKFRPYAVIGGKRDNTQSRIDYARERGYRESWGIRQMSIDLQCGNL